MKRILGVALLCSLGVGVAGCGAGNKAVTRSHVKWVAGPSGIKVIGLGTATLRNVKPDTRVSCQGAPPETVPHGKSSEAAVRGPVGRSIELSRSLNGTVTVSCSKSG